MSLRPTPPGQRELQLVPLTLDDLDTVWEMEKRAYTHPWSRLNFQDSLQSGYPAHMLTTPALPGDAVHPLTASGQLLLGYWVAMQVLDEVHLLNIAVAPEHRRQGWGQVLLQSLATQALAQGAQWLWLEVRTGNAPARGLYQRFGFQPMGVRKEYYPAGHGQREDAVVMNLNLHTWDSTALTAAPLATNRPPTP
ncbi:MAG: ribosomal-protein-alanine N-acetyltransferase [Polaromonas sp.]|nr:ribosomal-protein-alanine N-acetyltransferase [Polaromonas sp.]